MRDALFLALAYLRFHRVQSAAVTIAMALILVVPLATRLVLDASETALVARAAATPLVVGPRGGGVDVILNALYFSGAPTQTVPMGAADAIWDSGLAVAIPIHARFSAGGQPLVGTTLDYFEFRRLEVDRGRGLLVLGDAVLGAEAAGRLGLAPGDTLLTDPGNLFDLTGGYPLELVVAGILARSGSPDDAAVFVDVKTAWIAEGIGHGHADLVDAPEMVVGTNAAGPVASPAIRRFTRITPETIGNFHFHGASDAFPLSAVIAAPHDARAGTILEGRYLEAGSPLEILSPVAVVEGLLDTLFRIGRVLDAVALVAALAALTAIAVAIYLTLELRRGEIETMFHLGAQRWTMTRMLAAQVGLMLTGSVGLALLLLLPLALAADSLALALVGANP